MYRKELIGLLSRQSLSLREIGALLDLSPGEVEADLQHLRKSLRHQPYRLVVTPAHCRKCGFQFSRDKLRKPGRCPRCHATWTSEPLVAIEET